MTSRLAIIALAAASQLALAGPARATLIVGRNPANPTLRVDSAGRALITFRAGGKPQRVLVWGAVNALPPTRGRTQTAFKIDFSGGYGIGKPGYWRTFKNVCRPYTGPALAWYVKGSGCTAPDGSYWALQRWQRMLPNLGFRPWKAEQAVYELHVSHWRGPLTRIDVHLNWAWSGRFEQIFGRLTYRGRPVHGFRSTSAGVPLDTWGRNLYLDTYDSPYGRGWARENSFLAQRPRGGFCYSFAPRPPYPGYPDSSPRMGAGKKYRLTVLGPGVTPAVMWQGPSLGRFRRNDPRDAAIEAKAEQLKKVYALGSAVCHR
jgi:hypothetical protein